MKPMKTRFLRYTLGLIFLGSLISGNGNAQTDCKEQKVGRSYFSICPANIVTEKKKLFLTTQSLPKKIDGKNTFKVVHYYVSDRKKVETDEVFLEYSKFLKNLETQEFFVNGKEFNGILKIALPFKNEGVSTQYDGYDLLTYEFKEGRFVSKSKLTDVELEKEKAVIRPQ
jgi:F0F1-type ATP synthase, gamma subunit